MRRAAAALAAVLRRELAEIGAEAGASGAGAFGPVLFLVGSGDNGGDALYAAAELAEGGIEVVIAPVGSRMHPEASAAARFAGATFLETAPTSETDASDRADAPAAVLPDGFESAAHDAVIIVDGILGTGTAADPALRGRARAAVAFLCELIEGIDPEQRPRVVAVDLPSGIHPDDGRVPDETVLRATTTVTFGAAKAGLLIEPGADYAGRIEVVDLGLGPELSAMTPLVERA
ncbi:NAD(P)H-hydrate epimerase [Agromyces protaetiae]|nr:NAD(P)H-hydrate epimerase [Agromyces protaetiae]